jgi:hypothetical protein
VSIPIRIERAWIRGGTHLDAGPAALDEALLAAAKVVVGARDVTLTHMWGTLAEVAAGVKDGRELDEITIFVAGSLTTSDGAVAAFLPQR